MDESLVHAIAPVMPADASKEQAVHLVRISEPTFIDSHRFLNALLPRELPASSSPTRNQFLTSFVGCDYPLDSGRQIVFLERIKEFGGLTHNFRQ